MQAPALQRRREVTCCWQGCAANWGLRRVAQDVLGGAFPVLQVGYPVVSLCVCVSAAVSSMVYCSCFPMQQEHVCMGRISGMEQAVLHGERVGCEDRSRWLRADVCQFYVIVPQHSQAGRQNIPCWLCKLKGLHAPKTDSRISLSL